MTEKIPEEPRRPPLHLSAHPTWHNAVRSLFTDGDIRCMKRVRGLDLGDYQSVKAMARTLHEHLARGTMPPGRPWPREQVACFRQWIDDGCPLGEEPPVRLPCWRPTGAPHISPSHISPSHISPSHISPSHISPSQANAHYDDLCFIDPQVGWAIHTNGQILHTRDGGATWILQFQTPVIDDHPIHLRTIAFATPDQGWVGTLSSTHRLYHTEDGGQHWRLVTRLPPQAPTQISSLSVVDQHILYAAGPPDPRQPSRMMRTLNGGQHWTAWDMSPYASTLHDVHFFDAVSGLVVGGQSDRTRPQRTDLKPVILYTCDGGRTWDNQIPDLTAASDGGAWGSNIFFLNQHVGFVTLTGRHAGLLLKTRDGGRTWQRLPAQIPPGGDTHSIGFVDETLGWVGHGGDAHHPDGLTSETRDGGQTFSTAPHVGQSIRRFRILHLPPLTGPPIGYAAGSTVYKYSTESQPLPFVR